MEMHMELKNSYASNQNIDTPKKDDLEEKLRKLWKDKNIESIISIIDSCNERTPVIYMFGGLALYSVKRYHEALYYFTKYKLSSHSEFSSKVDFCIGNSLFYMKNYMSAEMSYIRAYSANPFDIEAISALIAVWMLAGAEAGGLTFQQYREKSRALLAEVSVFLKTQELSAVLLTAAKRILHAENMNHVHEYFNELAAKIFYPTEHRVKNESDTCYIFTQPLVEKNFLFGNREFGCSALFIKPIDYCYFLAFSDALLQYLGDMLQGYSRIVVCSTSAGAFFSIVLGHAMAVRFSGMEVTVHAFSPQTLAFGNDNLVNVTHYRRTCELIRRFPFMLKDAQKRGNLEELLSSTSLANLEIHMYYGDAEAVDRVEAARIAGLPCVHAHVLKGFPFHSSMAPYRYDEEGLKEIFSSFVPLTPPDGKKVQPSYSLEDLYALKRTLHVTLQDMFPLMWRK